MSLTGESVCRMCQQPESGFRCRWALILSPNLTHFIDLIDQGQTVSLTSYHTSDRKQTSERTNIYRIVQTAYSCRRTGGDNVLALLLLSHICKFSGARDEHIP